MASKSQQYKKFYRSHPDKARTLKYKKRGLGYKPLNPFFPGSSVHHLFLENNKDFCIYIPLYLHEIKHNPKTGEGMDTVNAIALSVFVNGLNQFLPEC